MTTTKKRLVIASVGIVILAVLVSAVYYGIRQIPSIDEQLPPGSTPIQVRITHPDNKTGWPFNFAIPIQIAANGVEPITSVDLYINGTLYDTHEIDAEAANQGFLTLWDWQPGISGKFILVARAMDGSGRTGMSNPVLIEAGPAAKTGSPIRIEEGHTWEIISQETGLSLEEIHQANPELDPKLELVPGSHILIPNAPYPVTNPNFIPAYAPPGEISAKTETPPVADLKSKIPPKWNFIDDLLFLIKNSIAK